MESAHKYTRSPARRVGAGNGAQCSCTLGIAPPFIVGEEEEAVLLIGPPNGDAEYVAQQLRRRVGLAAG